MACTLTRRIFYRKLANIYENFNRTKYVCSGNLLFQTVPLKNIYTNHQMVQFVYPPFDFKQYSTSRLNKISSEKKEIMKEKDEVKKLTLFQKFKQMYRDYWYILVPVHLVTSVAWFGSFYYMAKSGVDIVALLETWHISEKIVNPLKDSSMGYIALAYAMYKVATPLRYTVTLGGTTVSINYLRKWGYIKPVPSTERMKEIYREKKENLIGSIQEKKEGIKETKEQILKTVSKGTEKLKKQKINMKEKVTDMKEKS